MNRKRQALILLALVGLTCAGVLWLVTLRALQPVPADLLASTGAANHLQFTDRNGIVLNATYQNRWNLHHVVPLHQIPEFLAQAFIMAEDKRFYSHQGQDWTARLHALYQNLKAGSAVRGASTITEQVLRMYRPRPRSLWSRWLEGWEARRLEKTHSKLDILEFYLNQVPYAANRRGVAEAASYYFDRDLGTLSRHEMLVLAVLVRAPSRFDLFSGNRALLDQAVSNLAGRLADEGQLAHADIPSGGTGSLQLHRPKLEVEARHFLRHATRNSPHSGGARLVTTLDGELQSRLQGLLDARLRSLAKHQVTNGALVVADHQRGEVLAWVIGGSDEAARDGRLFDAITTPRQPGSALKPFLYALALERGWTAATLIQDAPLAEQVGQGLHNYRNYSRTFYGPVTLRSALANSLNTPAVRTIRFAGTTRYLTLLDRLGFESLMRDAEYYGEGLALGNGEVTLLELAQAYGALANRGLYRPFAVLMEDVGKLPAERVFSPEVSSLIANILSDPHARGLEFGNGGLLNLPLQTAVKTGTSSDYRDSWALGFDDRHIVGVWMGNLNQSPTSEISGSTGPALTLRASFGLLNRNRRTRALWLSPRLNRRNICADTGQAAESDRSCLVRMEYFRPGGLPNARQELAPEHGVEIRLRQPTPDLHLAYDPRIPDTHQAFEFVLQGVRETDQVEWRVDGADAVLALGARYPWSVTRGNHFVSASVWREGKEIAKIQPTAFVVK